MSATFLINPIDPNSEQFLYPHPTNEGTTFTFDTGLTVLLGANGAGKTTLINRIKRYLEENKIPYIALMKETITRDIESIAFWQDDISAFMNRLDKNYLSEGQAAKHEFAYLVHNIRQLIMSENENNERWIFIDGMDSSQSIDQLRDISGLFDAIIETAPTNIDVYLIVTTNQFELAKNRNCLCVSDNKVYTPKTYRDFSSIIMHSAHYLDKKRIVSEKAFNDTYANMSEATRL